MIFLFASTLFFKDPSFQELSALYNRLDPKSLSQQSAFCELYGQTEIGQKALKDTWKLLTGSSFNEPLPLISLEVFNKLIELINRPLSTDWVELSEATLKNIENLCSHFPNRKLKGHAAQSESETLALPPHEIDLARSLLLSELAENKNPWPKIYSYESFLDLMALQIAVRLNPNAKPLEIAQAISHFIFIELGFRFPPQSMYAQEIDRYTFLPHVVDSRRAVCLGMSLLYLCLAQRLGLSLEIVTPPGHIFIRCNDSNTYVNIETTARGIHLDNEEYLTLETRFLPTRNLKEVIGLAHFNQASVYWQQGKPAKALTSYRKAWPYLENDPLLTELMGYACLLGGNVEEGNALLKQIENTIPPHGTQTSSIVSDYLNHHIEPEAILILFTQDDKGPCALREKKERLESTLKKYPQFRAGWQSLASTYISLHRMEEALSCLIKSELLDATDLNTLYLLAALHAQQRDFPTASYYAKKLRICLTPWNHFPTAIKDLERYIRVYYPEDV